MRYFIFILSLLFLLPIESNAQILDRAKRQAKYRKRKKEDQAINQGLDAVEGIFKKKNKKKDKEENSDSVPSTVPPIEASTTATSPTTTDNPSTTKAAAIKIWTERYDFKPGKEIIFYDDFETEETGEIPSKWKYKKGMMEVVEVESEFQYVMSGDLGQGHPNWPADFQLPEQYTIEFDLYMADPKDNNRNTFTYSIYLFANDYKHRAGRIYVQPGKMSLANIVNAEVPNTEPEDYYNTWNHISISVNKSSIKGYYNDYRMFNSRLKDELTPNLFTLYNCCLAADKPPVFLIDNFKIAAGSHPRYKEEILEGKIVTNNIHFETNSAAIIPRSYAEIKRVAKVLLIDPTKQFRVDGHTDNVGGDASNLTLSQARAASVKAALIEMGIEESRLTTAGHGEAVPIAPNDTPEGRATNRRVEFVAL